MVGCAELITAFVPPNGQASTASTAKQGRLRATKLPDAVVDETGLDQTGTASCLFKFCV